ncbi:MAG: VanZ family protein [candidate division KSB1 bacterium]|nr:VanZ family protein [candidate division KSB1 bacterium]
MSPFVRYQLPAILYAVLIFVISSIPTLAPPPIGIEWDDKIYHFLEYGAFGYLCARAFYYQGNRVLRDFALIITLVTGSLYAVSDELHQSLVPGRYADVGDFLADVVGVILGVVLFARTRVPWHRARARLEKRREPRSRSVRVVADKRP